MVLKDCWKKLKAVFKDARALQLMTNRVDFNVSTCQNAELSTENPDDSALVRACESINAARIVESKLQEWSDDVSFFEMKIAKNQEKDECFDDGCFFEEEIKNLAELETNWLMEVIAVLRQF
ncbi:hypothetical protein CRYUN_Cryun12cG0001100 [Craigia yunnanensis]